MQIQPVIVEIISVYHQTALKQCWYADSDSFG